MHKVVNIFFLYIIVGMPLCFSDYKKIYEDSNSWPFRLKYTHGFSPDYKIPFNTRLTGVLIRIEANKDKFTAVIDFGGDGIHSLPVEYTDLIQRVDAIKNGSETKNWSNQTLLLANKSLSFEAGEVRILKAHNLENYDGVVYVKIDKDNVEHIKEKLSHIDDTYLKNKLVVFLPSFGYLESELIVKLHKETKLMEFALPRGFICRAINIALNFNPSEAIIVTDLNGKILHRSH